MNEFNNPNNLGTDGVFPTLAYLQVRQKGFYFVLPYEDNYKRKKGRKKSMKRKKEANKERKR